MAATATTVTGAREQILNRIRDALGRDTDEIDIAALRARIARHPRHIEPAFDESPAQRLCAKLEAAAASVARVDTLAEVGAALENYLQSNGLGQQLVRSGDALLQQIEWPPSLDLQQRVPLGADSVGITSALCAIAETGTLMLISGQQKPTSLNFLPDHHIVVLSVDQLVMRMEDAWDRLREERTGMPRSVNFISGPSKTADVEQTVEYGAHGPRCLHVILVG